MNSSRTSKRRTGPQLAIGLVTASVLAVGLAAPARAAGTNTVTSPGVINIANAANYVISGTADSAVTTVRVELLDTLTGLQVDATVSADSPTGKTWTATFNTTALAENFDLITGVAVPLEIFATYDGACPSCDTGIPDRTVTKDTEAPQVPTASPDGATILTAATAIDIVSLDPLDSTYFEFGTPNAANPTTASPQVTGPYTVSTTQQVKAIAFDPAGNPSPIMTANYTVNIPTPAAGTNTTLTAPAITQVFGTPVVLTAGVNPAGTPGTFELFDSGISLGAMTAGANPIAPTVGTHSYTATFTPTDPVAFSPSTSAPVALTITAPAATNTITTLTLTPATTAVVGTPVLLTAAVDAATAGTFEFFDGGASLGIPGAATMTVTPVVGAHSFTARFTPANPAAFNPSTTAVATSFTVTSPVVVNPPPVVVNPPPVVVNPPPVVVNPPPVVVNPPPVVVVLTAPKVIARTPAVNATGVSRVNNIMARFDKNVTGVNAASFTLKTRSGTAVTALVTYNPTTRMAMLNPVRTLLADTTYVATLSSAVTAGKSLAVTRWAFTTGARPSITARTPGVNARGVARAANTTIRFSERVSGVSGSSLMLMTTTGRRVAAVVSYNRTTRVATLNPSSRLAAGTRYTVVVGNSIKDMAGNRFAATRWSFTTAGAVRVTGGSVS